jgi:hypothetical protein
MIAYKAVPQLAMLSASLLLQVQLTAATSTTTEAAAANDAMITHVMCTYLVALS